MKKLDAEEKEILAAYDSGKTASVAQVKSELVRHRKVAKRALKKTSASNADRRHPA